jgi:hypothetical protein
VLRTVWRQRRAARSAARRVALTRCSPWAVPVAGAGWVLVSSLGSALVLLRAQAPGARLGGARPISARWPGRSALDRGPVALPSPRRRLRRRDLATLFVTSGDVAAAYGRPSPGGAHPGSRASRTAPTLAAPGPAASPGRSPRRPRTSTSSLRRCPSGSSATPGSWPPWGRAWSGRSGFRSSLRGGLLDARGTGSRRRGTMARVSTDAVRALARVPRLVARGGLGHRRRLRHPTSACSLTLTWLVERLPYVGEWPLARVGPARVDPRPGYAGRDQPRHTWPAGWSPRPAGRARWSPSLGEPAGVMATPR